MQLADNVSQQMIFAVIPFNFFTNGIGYQERVRKFVESRKNTVLFV